MTKKEEDADPDAEFDKLLDDLEKKDESKDLYMAKRYSVRTIRQMMLRSYLLGYLKGRNIINDEEGV